jgi:hypothetical protein
MGSRFYWPEVDRWEGVDFVVCVDAAASVSPTAIARETSRNKPGDVVDR